MPEVTRLTQTKYPGLPNTQVLAVEEAEGARLGTCSRHVGGGSRDNRRVAMHKSETSPELEGPGQLVGTREGCPKSCSSHVCSPCLPWATALSPQERVKLKPQPRGQAGGDWSPTLKGETEAWEAGRGAAGRVHPSPAAQASHAAPVGAVLTGAMGVGRLACPFSGPQGQAQGSGGSRGSWQLQSMIALRGR